MKERDHVHGAVDGAHLSPDDVRDRMSLGRRGDRDVRRTGRHRVERLKRIRGAGPVEVVDARVDRTVGVDRRAEPNAWVSQIYGSGVDRK